jgi:hypothetical protein
MTSNTYSESYNGKAKNPNVKVFSASWDRGMWILNSILVTLLGGITITLLVAGLYGMRENMCCAIVVIAASLIPVSILVIGALFAPLKYFVTDKNIVVKRFIRDVEIPLFNTISIEHVTYKYVFKKAVRIMGSGGGFGIYGNFCSPSLKDFRAYMTRRDKLVLMRTFHKPFVFTPDDPEGFIAAVKDGQSRPKQLRST